jgi:hypothetical protein
LAFHSGRETDHSPPSCDEVKEWVELYLHSPNAPSWRGAQWGGGSTGIAQENVIIHDTCLAPQPLKKFPVLMKTKAHYRVHKLPYWATQM